MLKQIQSPNAPAAVGPYSQAIEAGDFIFCSGQIGIDPSTNALVEGIENQTKQVLKNLDSVLQSAGVTKKDVVKTTVYLANMDDYVTMNNVYAVFFEGHMPARATVQVTRLPKDALVEIEAIATK